MAKRGRPRKDQKTQEKTTAEPVASEQVEAKASAPEKQEEAAPWPPGIPWDTKKNRPKRGPEARRVPQSTLEALEKEAKGGKAKDDPAAASGPVSEAPGKAPPAQAVSSPKKDGKEEEDPDTAIICLNGHVFEPEAYTTWEYLQRFCTDCGAALISKCQKCAAPFGGHIWHFDDLNTSCQFTRPNYCTYCGTPHPWRKTHQEAVTAYAEDLAQLAELAGEEKKQLVASMGEVTHYIPLTHLAAARVRRMMNRLAPEAMATFEQLLSDVSPATAATIVGPWREIERESQSPLASALLAANNKLQEAAEKPVTPRPPPPPPPPQPEKKRKGPFGRS
jgi:hypothetical protein